MQPAAVLSTKQSGSNTEARTETNLLRPNDRRCFVSFLAWAALERVHAESPKRPTRTVWLSDPGLAVIRYCMRSATASWLYLQSSCSQWGPRAGSQLWGVVTNYDADQDACMSMQYKVAWPCSARGVACLQALRGAGSTAY